eukprot:TRINITY_DN60074_c0_g1_i1.p1 TRINITY_DN60074_c0_g1~~TRINITY_DN60074_c0_g1_i1.p1  ORF type:complete len:569 (+),score=150.98 TRINITY_DN60074_c0_g1_i1:102-1709(+)
MREPRPPECTACPGAAALAAGGDAAARPRGRRKAPAAAGPLLGFTAALLCLVARGSGQAPEATPGHADAAATPEGGTARYAWTTIFYEAGRNDPEYFLGARVLMESIRQSGTKADRVVLVGRGTQSRYLRGFEGDGCKVKVIDNVPSPWGKKTPRRFLFALNKLAVWRMTEYERVIYLDADVIVLQQADFLFKCGHFCAVFMNPINFHTAILVIKPSEARYDDMLTQLKTLGSFDGADQGFFNSYFQGLSAATEWTKGQPPSNAPLNRIPVQYNMNHMYYYEKMRWGGVWGDASDIVTMTYPVTPIGKPWYWYWYPLLDMHWWWHRYRMSVDSFSNYPRELALLVLAPFLGQVLAHLERRVAARHGGARPQTAAGEVSGANLLHEDKWAQAGVWCVWGRAHCIATCVGFAMHVAAAVAALHVAPGITPPLLAWPLFLAYHWLFLTHGAQLLWLRLHGVRLRYERRAVTFYVVSWLLFLVCGGLPVYPHGLVKLAVALVIVPLTSIALTVAMIKTVYDSNIRAVQQSGPGGSYYDA